MVGLLDIAPQSETVAGATVKGLSLRALVSLIGRFPEIKDMLGGGKPNMDGLTKFAPEAVAAIIAAGTGSVDDREVEKVAADLGLEVQMDFLEAIWRLTLPGGFGPFVYILEKLGVLGGVSGKLADTNSQEPSNT